MKKITSAQNPLIKEISLLLDKAKARKKNGQFVIEGQREIHLAQKGGYQLELVLVVPEIFPMEFLDELVPKNTTCIEITKEIYQKLAYRETTEGILAIAKTKLLALTDLHLTDNPLILVAEGLEKPGNIGALLRTADAARCTAVIIANPKSDLYNPNIIRSSVGCLFTTPLAVATTQDAIAFLQKNNVGIYSAILQEAVPYYTQNYTSPTALVVGTEATGLTDDWRKASNKNIIIPMQGEIDSMNVSVAAAILLFEAKRQRGF